MSCIIVSSLTFKLYLFYAVAAVVTLSTNQSTIAQGSRVTLTCTYNGDGIPFLFGWRRNGLNVGSVYDNCDEESTVNTALYEYSCPDGKQHTWIIKVVTLEERYATWHCIAYVPSTKDSNHLQLDVVGRQHLFRNYIFH